MHSQNNPHYALGLRAQAELRRNRIETGIILAIMVLCALVATWYTARSVYYVEYSCKHAVIRSDQQ